MPRQAVLAYYVRQASLSLLRFDFMSAKNHVRNRIVTLRMTDHDYKRLADRALRSGATTVSAYIRHACLTGKEFEMPAWAELRALRNEVIKLAAAIQAARPGPARDTALETATLALERICRF